MQSESHTLNLTQTIHRFGLSIYVVHVEPGAAAIQVRTPPRATATVAATVDGRGSPAFFDVPDHPEITGLNVRPGDAIDFITEWEAVSLVVEAVARGQVTVRLRSVPHPAQPAISIAWDPEVMSAAEYADLVAALGDVVRASGGRGVARLKAIGYGVPVGEGVPA